MDDFLTTAKDNKYRDQEVRIVLYVPVGKVLAYERDNSPCWIISAPLDRNMSGCEMSKYLWEMDNNGELQCLDCPVNNDDQNNDDDNNGKIIINEDGVDIDIKGDGDNFKLKIDEKGVQFKTNESKMTEIKKDTVQ